MGELVAVAAVSVAAVLGFDAMGSEQKDLVLHSDGHHCSTMGKTSVSPAKTRNLGSAVVAGLGSRPDEADWAPTGEPVAAADDDAVAEAFAFEEAATKAIFGFLLKRPRR